MEMQVQRILDEIKSTSVQTFEKNLVGIYVHGSLALGCFSWDNSDIDFIVVLKSNDVTGLEIACFYCYHDLSFRKSRRHGVSVYL